MTTIDFETIKEEFALFVDFVQNLPEYSLYIQPIECFDDEKGRIPSKSFFCYLIKDYSGSWEWDVTITVENSKIYIEFGYPDLLTIEDPEPFQVTSYQALQTFFLNLVKLAQSMSEVIEL